MLCDNRPWCTFAWIFGSDENLIAAYLAKLADAQAMGRVSGWRLGLRLPGRLASLGICLAYISAAQQSGQAAALFDPVTMLMAGSFAVAATPTFLSLRKRALESQADSPAFRANTATLPLTYGEVTWIFGGKIGLALLAGRGRKAALATATGT